MLKTVFSQTQIQERILASTSMVDQAQVCQLLGLPTADPSAVMREVESRQAILSFSMNSCVIYPLLQFDVEGCRIFPVIVQLIARKPQSWSDFRLLYWLTRLHLDMDTTPAQALGRDEGAVIAAFEREIEPPMQG